MRKFIYLLFPLCIILIVVVNYLVLDTPQEEELIASTSTTVPPSKDSVYSQVAYLTAVTEDTEESKGSQTNDPRTVDGLDHLPLTTSVAHNLDDIVTVNEDFVGGPVDKGARSKPIQWIVIHYTAGNAQAVQQAKDSSDNSASAQFFVDKDTIAVQVPESHWCDSTGGDVYSDRVAIGSRNLGKSGSKELSSENSVNIEICGKRGGHGSVNHVEWEPDPETVENVLALTRCLMDRYDIPHDHVVRHGDWGGKRCPAYWIDHPHDDSLPDGSNQRWLDEFYNRIVTEAPSTTQNSTTSNSADKDDVVYSAKAGKILSDGDNPASYFKIYEIKKGDDVYKRIKGKSFQGSATKDLSTLRYIKCVHVNYNGKNQVGELVVNEALANDVLSALKDMFNAKYPIEKMHLIDDYWEAAGKDISKLDNTSIEDNNTSCFCDRPVTGGSKPSQHAYGRAIDFDPLYNPYFKVGSNTSHKRSIPYMNRQDKSLKHMIQSGDDLYNAFVNRGFTWGGSWNTVKDYQHFEKKG